MEPSGLRVQKGRAPWGRQQRSGWAPGRAGHRSRGERSGREGADRGGHWLPPLPSVRLVSGCPEAPLPLSQGGDAREAGPARRTAGKRRQEKVHNGAFHREPVARCQDRLRGGQHAGVGLPCALPLLPVPCLPPCWGARRPLLPPPLPLLLLWLLRLCGPCFLFALCGSGCHGRGRGGNRLFGQGSGG